MVPLLDSVDHIGLEEVSARLIAVETCCIDRGVTCVFLG